MRQMISYRPLSAPLLLGLLVQTAACDRGAQQPPASQQNNAAQQVTSTPTPSPALKAAEPFEVLTEQAFTAPPNQLDTLIGDARTALQAATPSLPGEGRTGAERQMNAIAAARRSVDRVGIALSAVEAYRTLVEAQDPALANPPIAVSLLDYAGFRYDALAQAPNPDWNEMRRMIAFAREQWQQIAPRINSQALQGVLVASLDGMSNAADRRDVASARAAAAVELALVDLIEEQVARSDSSQARPASGSR